MDLKPDVYVLKTRAITGALVPANGEHIEYAELDRAIADGRVLKDVLGEEVYVVDYRNDAVVAFI